EARQRVGPQVDGVDGDPAGSIRIPGQIEAWVGGTDGARLTSLPLLTRGPARIPSARGGHAAGGLPRGEDLPHATGEEWPDEPQRPKAPGQVELAEAAPSNPV